MLSRDNVLRKLTKRQGNKSSSDTSWSGTRESVGNCKKKDDWGGGRAKNQCGFIMKLCKTNRLDEFNGFQQHVHAFFLMFPDALQK